MMNDLIRNHPFGHLIPCGFADVALACTSKPFHSARIRLVTLCNVIITLQSNILFNWERISNDFMVHEHFDL